jgi:hypothetical protein
MNGHPTQDELSRFLHGGLRADRVSAVARHLQECQHCTDRAMPPERLTRATESLQSGLATPPARRWPWFAAAAAAAAAIVVLLVVRAPRRTTPVEVLPPVSQNTTTTAERQPAYARADWKSAVDDALRRGTIRMPAELADLQLEADPERALPQQTSIRLAPAGVIVESTRPSFRWTGSAGMTYVVTIFDGRNVAAESPLLREAQWQPGRELRRGRVYQWQVEVRGDGVKTILPEPPAPPALFRVLDAASHEELESARAAHSGDSLLLGVLYARRGLRAEALQELRKTEGTEAQRLLRDIEAWPMGTR